MKIMGLLALLVICSLCISSNPQETEPPATTPHATTPSPTTPTPPTPDETAPTIVYNYESFSLKPKTGEFPYYTDKDAPKWEGSFSITDNKEVAYVAIEHGGKTYELTPVDGKFDEPEEEFYVDKTLFNIDWGKDNIKITAKDISDNQSYIDKELYFVPDIYSIKFVKVPSYKAFEEFEGEWNEVPLIPWSEMKERQANEINSLPKDLVKDVEYKVKGLTDWKDIYTEISDAVEAHPNYSEMICGPLADAKSRLMRYWMKEKDLAVFAWNESAVVGTGKMGHADVFVWNGKEKQLHVTPTSYIALNPIKKWEESAYTSKEKSKYGNHLIGDVITAGIEFGEMVEREGVEEAKKLVVADMAKALLNGLYRYIGPTVKYITINEKFGINYEKNITKIGMEPYLDVILRGESVKEFFDGKQPTIILDNLSKIGDETYLRVPWKVWDDMYDGDQKTQKWLEELYL